MFTIWLTCLAFLSGSKNLRSRASAQPSVSFELTCRVKCQPEEELILHCGDGKREGVVQYWHTPFGDLHGSGPQSKLDPVFVHHDGNLVIPNSSIHHCGLYYCVLRHTQGSTLWPYELHSGLGDRGGCPTRRFRRSAGFLREREAVVSDGVFVGAVAASVLLTFVVGFSAGALSRTHVLRCLHAIGARLSPEKRIRHSDVPDGLEVPMTTLPPMSDNQVFRMGATPADVPVQGNTDTLDEITTPSPPAKPKRSFRQKQEGKEVETEGVAYLEGCDYKQVGRLVGKGVDVEAEEEEETTKVSFCLQDDEGSQSETEYRSEEKEEEEGASSDKKEAAGEQIRDEDEEEDEGSKPDESKESEHLSTDEEEGVKDEEVREKAPSGSSRRCSRVIRLYQYNEEGRRYGHLQDPGPEGLEPPPRLQRRSQSLTRLNAIMAAAAGGPLESGKERADEKPHFHMEI